MVHIVQVVLSGSAEPPRVFLSEADAQAAYVACARKYWATSYTTYCERNGQNADSFAAAQAFAASFDLADRSRLHYWHLTPEDAGEGADLLLPGVAALVERREQLTRLAREIEQASGIVRDGLAELLDTIGGVSGSCEVPAVVPGAACQSVPCSANAERNAPGRFTPVELPAEETEEQPVADQPKPDDERFKTKEWRDYVSSLMGMCGGNRSEFPLFTRHDWRQAVYSSATSLEYWDWAALEIDNHIEAAQKAGYSVIDDPDKDGHYRFKTPAGEVNEHSCEAQGDAWCRAGLHLKGK